MCLNLLWKTALSTAVYQGAFFTLTCLKKTDKFTDFAGTTNFALIALQTFLSKSQPVRSKVATSFVVLWAGRLGGFLLYRILKWGHDKRFNSHRGNIKKLTFFWSVQAIWCWVVSLPITLLNASSHAAPLGNMDYVGWTLFLSGLLIESVADVQKFRHKMNSDKWLESGLWRYSRHPNYFGEIMIWFGVYFSCGRGLRGLQHVSVISPLFVSSLLLFLSGIPILEKSADRKHGGEEKYLDYKRSTSVLIPCAPGIYKRLPTTLRQTVFLEWAMYDNIGKRKDA